MNGHNIVLYSGNSFQPTRVAYCRSACKPAHDLLLPFRLGANCSPLGRLLALNSAFYKPQVALTSHSAGAVHLTTQTINQMDIN